jgi:O-antigen ligase
VAGALAAVGLVVAAAFVGPGAATFRTSRLSADSADRSNEWRATASVARKHLLTGVGPSHLQVEWRNAQGEVIAASYTHNEYLQLAAEDGVIAPIVVVGALAIVFVALARRARVTDASGAWLAAGALAGLVAFAVHSAFDFMWHVPVVPVVVAALVGAALARAPVATGMTDL